MSKLFKLKEWLTVPEAARHLSIVFEEEVTEADVLRLALDGHFGLSLRFVNDFLVRSVKNEIWLEIKNDVEIEQEHKQFDLCCVLGNSSIPAQEKFEWEGMIQAGTWQIVMRSGASKALLNAFQKLTGGSSVYLDDHSGIIIKGVYDYFYQVQIQPPEMECNDEGFVIQGPAMDFPFDSTIVVPTSGLREFEQSINDTPPSVEISAIKMIDDAEREGNQVPEELDIALIAWRAACTGIKQGEKPGVFIRDWLAKNYPALSDEARKRIAIVANWDKTPGAGKKSPGQ